MIQPISLTFGYVKMQLISSRKYSMISGIASTYHPAPRVRIPSKPSTIFDLYSSSWVYICHWNMKRTKMKQKEAGIGPF